MPPKRKSARLAEMEAAAPNKKVKYNDDYESDIEDDYDDAYGAVESDVEDIEPEVELDPEEIARLAAIATQEAQAARAEMRVLLSKLPNAEAEQIREIFDDAESYEQPGARYDWSKLPAEVKNLIYRYTFVSEKPVRPHVVYPNVPERRRVTKYKLGAQFLRCSKEIYAEGRPILLGENVFEITNQFRAAMGEDKARKTSTMVRKVVLPCSKASWNVLQHLSRMDNLEELTIIHDRAWYNQPIGVTTDDCARYFDNIKSNLEWFLTGHKAYKIFFVTCVGRQADTMSDGIHKDTHLATRFEVKWRHLIQSKSIAKDGAEEVKVWRIGQHNLTLDAQVSYYSKQNTCFEVNYGHPQLRF